MNRQSITSQYIYSICRTVCFTERIISYSAICRNKIERSPFYFSREENIFWSFGWKVAHLPIWITLMRPEWSGRGPIRGRLEVTWGQLANEEARWRGWVSISLMKLNQVTIRCRLGPLLQNSAPTNWQQYQTFLASLFTKLTQSI